MAEEQTPTETSTTEATAQTETAAAETAETAAPEDEALPATALGGGEEAVTEEVAATEETEAAPVIPETYELTPPEGFEKLDADAVAAATPVFKEIGLTNEQANKLMPVVGDYAKKIIAERDQAFLGQILEQRKSWLESAKADPEIGGANWDASMTSAARALDRLGFPKASPLRVALDESGFGNHPEMIRAWNKVGKAIGEDTDFVRSDANAAVKPKSDAELFYPTSKG